MSNDTPRSRCASADTDDELYDQAGEIESPVESVGEGAEVLASVLAVPEGLVGSGDHGLEVAQHRVGHLNCGRSRGLRRPTTSTVWMQPASVTAAKHPGPSLSTRVPGSKLDLTHLEIASLVKPDPGVTLTSSTHRVASP
jgi:hypothetical protein